jgi:ribosomal-protein-alanine N-acetyltransferase
VYELLKGSPEAARWSLNAYQRLGELGTPGWVAETSGVVAGFLLVRVIPPEAEILNLAVAPSARRKGEGGALVKAALEEFRMRRVSRVFLEVRESNKTGIAFYEKHGFSRTGRRSNYYRDPDEAAIIMELKLAD